MMTGYPANRVSWQLLGMIAAITVAVGGGAIVFGSFGRQIDVNTNRLFLLEQFADSVRAHNADTLARETAIERRLDKLESSHQ